MKLELKTLIAARETLKELSKVKGLRPVDAYRIAKNIKAIKKELDVYDETRTNILKEKANKDEKGEPIIKTLSPGVTYFDLTPEANKEFTEEIKPIEEEKVNVSIKKINLNDLAKAELSPADINNIDFMITFQEE